MTGGWISIISSLSNFTSPVRGGGVSFHSESLGVGDFAHNRTFPLEGLIRDPDTNPTTKCTAIRTLREIAPEAPPPAVFAALDDYRGRTVAGRGRS